MRIFSLLLVITLSLFAAPEMLVTLGYHRDFNSALAIAKKENKPLMLVVSTSYCPWCRKFERKTLASASVSEEVKKYYIAVVVDRNKDSGTFPQKFQTPRIPTVFFIDPNSAKDYWQTMGYLNKNDFRDALKEAKALYKKLPK